MSWKARSTSAISSRPVEGRVRAAFPSANRRALSRRTASRWMIPWRNRRARIRVETTIAAPPPIRSRPAAPRTCGGRSIRCRSSPSSSPRISSMVARSVVEELGAPVELGRRPIPRPSGPAGPRRRSSPGRRRIRPASSRDPGRLPRDCPRPAPAAPRAAPAPAPGRPGTARTAAGSPEKTRPRIPRIALDQAAVQLLDLGDDLLGVDGPSWARSCSAWALIRTAMKTAWTSRGTAIRVRPFLKIVN